MKQPFAIFLLGGGGTGKTTLLNLYLEKTNGEVGTISEVARTIMNEQHIRQADLHEDHIFWDLQQRIVHQQLKEERYHEDSRKSFISDRCLIDAVVYAFLRFPDRFPQLSMAFQEDQTTRALNEWEQYQTLISLVGDASTAQKVLERYRRSLLVLVPPFSDTAAHDDGVRWVMNSQELNEFTRCCCQILKALQIPFVELKRRDPRDRLRELENHIQAHLARKEEAFETIESNSQT